ncbi:MAG: hypothetical protein K6C05_08645 [Anaerovibrio sp.]|uniref:hypothetical protein n=1 Tax=Anaerovibrio sp. TaxID=1872532 RepID=UPI0025E2703B|nr:hypothetical protein [Anaerovibrio sp.]MCR5176905.1 hypothetical protein [Anaerovibrio sp.]
MKKKALKAAVFGLALSVSATAMAATGMSGLTPLEGRPEDNSRAMLPKATYQLAASHKVEGRQGVASEGQYFWVSGSKTLAKYDKNWKLLKINKTPFDGYKIPSNHIGDIDVYNNEIYVGAENFMDGVGKDIQIAIHDGDTLKLKKSFPFEPASGQEECSGIAVNPDTQTVWMCSWVGEESGRYLYEYDLKTGKYLRKVHIQAPPQWVQGMAYFEGSFYLTADDGTADEIEPDHVYRVDIKPGASNAAVVLERTLDDVTFQGEIEGITFDKSTRQMLVHYNRGSRIVLGMVKGFYPGYDKEISEVFVYNIK